MKNKKDDEEATTDLFIERKIVTGLIVSDDFIQRIARIYQPDCFVSVSAKLIAKWCLDHYRKYGKAPRRDIEGIYAAKVKSGLDADHAEAAEQILSSLNDDYESTSSFDLNYLLDQTQTHFQERMATALHEKQRAALEKRDIDLYCKLHTEFNPISLNEGENIDAGELYDMKIGGPRWLVKDLIPIGLTILGGRSKVGKSYFILNLSMALCQGKYMFGDEDTGFKGQRGSVLYLSLEDGKQRFQKRMREIDPEPDLKLLSKYLKPFFTWEKLHRGGLQAIEQHVKQMPSPKLVVVDVLARIWNKKSGTGGGGLYSEEYSIYGPLADIAHRHEMSVVVVTHTTKARAVDVFDEILGGMGTQGPADNLIVLANDIGGRKRFSIRGKDIEEKHLAFENPGGPATWIYLGEVGEMQKTASRQEIVDILRAAHRPMTLQEIREELQARGNTTSSAHVLVRSMLKEGDLEQREYGSYQVAGFMEAESDAIAAKSIKRSLKSV